MTNNNSRLIVKDTVINVAAINGEDYICLTDMVRGNGGTVLVEKWLRNKNTIEFLGVWETLNNPKFKTPEFGGIRNEAGSNKFLMSAKQWIETTGSIGISARAGRYGGTYAHRDIAFEFGTWVSPEFKLLLIKDFQRLKQLEAELEHWDYRRFLTKVNYRLQTSAVSETIIPLSTLPKSKHFLLYAEEADIVNLALFGMAAKDWRSKNPKLAKTGNIRDFATLEQLTVLANLESTNSMYISQELDKEERFELLRAEAIRQLSALVSERTPLMSPSKNKQIKGKA